MNNHLKRIQEALLIRRDSFLVLNFGLHVVDGVASFHIKRDGFASQGLDEDLHATTEAEHQVKSGLLLDVVILGFAYLRLP